LRSSSNFQTKI